jgi:pantoate--beta-alanine ligase
MISLIKNHQDLQSFQDKTKNRTIGFVPTMGNLHDGHLSLLERSLQENDVSVISIYVNPTQFAAHEDLEKYPRTFLADQAKVETLGPKHPGREIFIFFPEDNDIIYPSGFNDFISVPSINRILEGQLRPTHFDGVATVVKRLFNLINPTKAYFGKKDYQQLRVIELMTIQEKLPVEIIGMPIIREQNGLAMSSRNTYLTEAQRSEAASIYLTLGQIANLLKEQGLQASITQIAQISKRDPRYNYLEIRKQDDLLRPNLDDKHLVILANYQMGKTRLLDNIEVNL